MPTITGQTVWLPALVRENPWLEDYIFDDCTLVGPIALVLDPTATLEDNSFDGSGIDAVLVTVPNGVTITWAAGVRRSTIRRCAMRGIALVGTAEKVERMRAGFKEHT